MRLPRGLPSSGIPRGSKDSSWRKSPLFCKNTHKFALDEMTVWVFQKTFKIHAIWFHWISPHCAQGLFLVLYLGLTPGFCSEITSGSVLGTHFWWGSGYMVLKTQPRLTVCKASTLIPIYLSTLIMQYFFISFGF